MTRDIVYVKFRKSGLKNDYLEYKQLRNHTKRMVKKAKSTYVQNLIQENQNDSKYLWKYINNLGFSSKSKSKKFKVVLKNDKGDMIFDDALVANRFNSFFCIIATDLIKKLAFVNFDCDNVTKYYNLMGMQNDGLVLYKVDESCVRRLLLSINTQKATGLDGIPSRFLRDSATAI